MGKYVKLEDSIKGFKEIIPICPSYSDMGWPITPEQFKSVIDNKRN